jgi:hypothetical protein
MDEFRSQDFGLKPELGSTHGIELGVSILSPEWNAERPRRQGRYWTTVARLFRGIDFVQVRVYGGWIYGGEAGSGHEDSSHNILTLDALQVLSRSQVTWSCQCPMRM